jgi:hypothetical protein
MKANQLANAINGEKQRQLKWRQQRRRCGSSAIMKAWRINQSENSAL